MNNQKDKYESIRRTRRKTRIIHNPSLNNVTITDDLNVDPESDSNFFMTLIIEALDKLGKLSDVQSRLIQGLRFELRSLIDTHISTFVRSLETSGTITTITTHFLDREILWTIIQNQNNVEVAGVNKAAVQGQLLMEMLQGLFTNLNGVLSNFRFVIEVIGMKLGRTGVSETENENLNIKLTKEVLSRLKGTIKRKVWFISSC